MLAPIHLNISFIFHVDLTICLHLYEFEIIFSKSTMVHFLMNLLKAANSWDGKKTTMAIS